MTKANGTVRALHDHVIVEDMHFGERVTKSGIIITSDDAKSRGIRPRWGKVYAIGPKQTDIRIGDWVLVEHGRWTRGIQLINDSGAETVVRRVDTDAIMAVADTCPEYDETIGDAV